MSQPNPISLSRTAINNAGNALRQDVKPQNYNAALKIANSWREDHGKPMDHYFNLCAKLAARTDPDNIIVAERLKRLPTIINKLQRFPNMRLSAMQDIAGVRIIVKNTDQLPKIERTIKSWKGYVREKDYIKKPKPSGYRGKHLICQKDGKFVEIQLRTELQHLWATSVETIDTFLGTSLKTTPTKSYWQDFFVQASAAFALAENLPNSAGYSSPIGLLEALNHNIAKHHIRSKIGAYSCATFALDNQHAKNAYYVVLNLNSKTSTVNIAYYPEYSYSEAYQFYKQCEKDNDEHHNVVLVAINDIKKVQAAYPNFFMDLREFIDKIDILIDVYKKI